MPGLAKLALLRLALFDDDHEFPYTTEKFLAIVRAAIAAGS